MIAVGNFWGGRAKFVCIERAVLNVLKKDIFLISGKFLNNEKTVLNNRF